jgi:hypothetical protein
MDNLNSDMYVRPDPTGRPDPPGSSDFVFQYIDASFDGAGTASTITDYPPIESPSEKYCVSSSSATNSPTWPTNTTNKVNTSEDPPTNNNATLSPDDEVLLSTVFPHHSLIVKHFQEYATTNGFMIVDRAKQYFTTTEYSNYFPEECNHSFGSQTIKSTTQTRRGYFRCSPKSHGRIKGDHCCFNVPYYWDSSHKKIICCPVGSNLSHNHQLLPQSTVVDGRTIVHLERSLSPEEFNSIKEQVTCRVHIPQMRVNLEEYFPDRSFSS